MDGSGGAGDGGEQLQQQQQQQQELQSGSAGEVPWATGDAPLPPIFGNANAEAGDEFKGINLDDVFSGVFFSPEGDLLDIPSDGDDSLNLTLSSASISDGANHPQFAQFAVLSGGDSGAAESGVGGMGGGNGAGAGAEAALLNPMRDSSHQLQELLGAAAAGPSIGGGADMAVTKAEQAVKAAQAYAQVIVSFLRVFFAMKRSPTCVSSSSLSAPPLTADCLPATPTIGWPINGLRAPPSLRSPQSQMQTTLGGSGGSGVGNTVAGLTLPTGGIRHKVSSKDLTEEQRIERRERNREHAKRSRVRKKFLLDSLQRSVDAIQAENDSLKGSIVGSLGERGRELVSKCVPADTGGSLVTANPKQATKILDDPDYSLVKALQTAQQNFVITDASLPDNPIVFASGGFLELTRYKLTEVLGRNCRFLQGPETDPKAVDKIRKAIDEGYDTSVCLLNYRADGTTFWNQFFVASLRDGKGDTVNYVGVQCKVGDDYAKIVVTEQNRQLASPSSSGARRGAQSRQKPQPSITPGAGAAAATGGV
ncbi:unnamed protein product [Scytosiphon promiscuus]